MKSRTGIRFGKLSAVMLATALVLGSFITIPTETYAASASDIQVGDYVDIGKTDAPGYTGVPHWRVLDKADDGSLLLMSEYLWRGNGTDSNAGISFVSQGAAKDLNGQVLYWRGTNAETWCNDFESAVLDGVENLSIKRTTGLDPEFYYTQSLYAEEYNKEIHFAAANAVLYENGVFFLSAEEADRYMKDPRSRAAFMPNADSPSQWLLRSSQNELNWASEVKTDGELTAVRADTRRAARPVFRAKFAEGTSFIFTTDDTGAKTWKIGENQTEPGGQADPKDNKGTEDPKYNEVVQGHDADGTPAPVAKINKVKILTLNTTTVNAKAVDRAVKKAGGSSKTVTKIILGSKVKKISPKTFAKYKKLTALEVRTKKLTKKRVRNALKGSGVRTIKVKVSKKATKNKKYVKKYKKIFTKKNAGKKVKVR